MAILYFFIIKLYSLAIRVGALFNDKAARWVAGRKNWHERYSNELNPGEKRILFHCPSLGEFEQGKPVLESIKNNFPDYKIVLTFFSPSGFEARKNDPVADYVFYLPSDGPVNAKKFITLIDPSMVFFVKYDFWHFYIKELKDRKIPVFFISSIFRPNQVFFQWYGKFFDRMLRRVTHFFVQNQGSLELLYKNSISQVTVTGDTRFDRVYQSSLQSKLLPEIEVFKNSKKLLVAGSTWAEDEKVIAQLYPEIRDSFKLVIAPHEIDERKLSDLEQRLGGNSIRFSQWNKIDVNKDILIIDNVGMLSSVYRYADAAYIGGGFGKGIHNILEAAVYGIPVFMGPHYKKFREAAELIHWKGAFSIQNGKELRHKFAEITGNPARMEKIRETNLRYISNNKGATELIINFLKLNLHI